MKAEKLRRVREIVRSASVLSGDDRQDLLLRECEGDDELLMETRRLLEAADDLTVDQVPEDPATRKRDPGVFVPGDEVSHYRIIDRLGQGGMGVVYRAVDVRLNRPVAIKFLPPAKISDVYLRERFVLEAQAASALNHPNIITIHGIEPIQDGSCIVMEFVDGKTLKEMLSSGTLALPEIVALSVQIADAVATAHAAGIIHLDLKPANIMVTARGLVKLLDFGIAKLTDPGGTSSTRGSSETSPGVVAGSAAYMSPEQARGLELDARSDIFSFGIVLYEMLSGRHPFASDSARRKAKEIVDRDPAPLRDAVPDAPEPLERLIGECLRKDRGERLQTMEEAHARLDEFAKSLTGTGSGIPAVDPSKTRPGLLATAAAGFALLAIGAIYWSWTQSRSTARSPRTLSRLTSDPGLSSSPAISADGKLMCFSSDRGGRGNLNLWVQQLGGSNPIRVTSTDSDEIDPAFSPDGTQIAFRSDREGGGVFVVPALGGDAHLLVPGCRRPRYAPDGRSIACWTGELGTGWIPGSARILLAPSAGGAPRPLFPEFAVSLAPVWMPDGKRILFLGRRVDKDTKAGKARGEIDWWIGSLDGGEPVQTGATAVFNEKKLTPRPGALGIAPDAVLPDGSAVLFSARQGDTTMLWQIALSPKSGKLTGEPIALSSGTEDAVHPAANHESIVFSSQTVTVNVWSLPSDTDRGKVTGELQPLTDGIAYQGYPSISADGQTLAYISARSGSGSVWIKDLASGRESQLTHDPIREYQPKISPDGSRVAFWRWDGKKSSSQIVALAGGLPKQIRESCGPPTHFSPDGTKILLESFTCAPNGLILADLTTGKQQHIIVANKPTNDIVYAGRFSPDQRWVVFHRTMRESTLRKVFVAPIRDFATPIPESAWIPVSDEGRHVEAAWAPGGNLIYYLSDRDGFRCIWGQRLNPVTKAAAGETFALRHFHSATRSILGVTGSVGGIGITALKDRIILALGDRRGNIWALNPEPRK